MIDVQNTDANEAGYWLELANGGGVLLRKPSDTTPSAATYRQYRQPKRLEAPGAQSRGEEV
jgi:hypothetical protein